MLIKKTKIVCTIGPASRDPKILKQLMLAGMDVARLNCSHGTNEEREVDIKNIRETAEKIDKQIAIFADLQGPKIRLGKFEGKVEIKTGQKITLSLNPVADELPIQYDLTPFIKKGERIYLNDGLVQLKTLEITQKQIKTEALNNGWVSSNKGVNVPDTLLKGATFTQQDKENAIFALKHDVDYLALSFIQTVNDLKPARELIKKYNPRTKIIVKIEKNEAVQNIEEIIQATDAVMVARGDLGIEMNASDVPIVQQKLIKLCRQHNKPVIVATQMLESMIENPRATRAEVSDVASAVLDQADAVMLSAESASGKYPVEAVQTMSDVINSVEKNSEYKHYIKINWENIQVDNICLNAITSSAASIAYRTHAKAIIAGTATGKTAKILSAFRPDAPIIAIAHDKQTCQQLALIWGVYPIEVPPTTDFNKFLKDIYQSIHQHKLLQKGDRIVVVTGLTAGVSGTTNTVKIDTLPL